MKGERARHSDSDLVHETIKKILVEECFED